MKTTLIIRSWMTNEPLFEYTCEGNTIKKTLEEAVRRGINLSEANLQGANLAFANLEGANLAYSKLQGAYFREANLTSAKLRSANLFYANLTSANLEGADLTRVILFGAKLKGANFKGANLSRTGLSGDSLFEADLNGANNLRLYWHVHHDVLVENLLEPLQNRIDYIKMYKPKKEVKLRLKLIKKVKAEKLPTTKDGWIKLHQSECGCGWDGNTIFTKENGWKGVNYYGE